MAVLAFSPEIVAARREGIGGSEIGQIIGLSPWGGAHSVWLEKTGRAPPREDTVDTLYGKAMEPGVRALYEHATGMKVQLVGNLVHPKYSIVRALPDGLVGEMKTLQIKCPRYHTGWGEPGTHDFPRWLWPQITWEMAVAGRPYADVVALHGRDISIYPECPFDEELFLAMVEAALRFWRDYVVPDREPPLDGTASSSAFIRDAFPQSQQSEYIQDDSAEMAMLAQQYAAAKAAEREAEMASKSLYNQIAARIGAYSGIEGKWGGISFNNTRRTKIDYEQACRDRGMTDADLARYSSQTIYRTMRVRHVK